MKTFIMPKLEVEEIPLSNGSTLYYRHFEEAPRIALGIYLFGGNRIEPLPGVADMIDDLLSEGTEKRSSEQIAIDLDSISLDVDMDTRRDCSIISATFLEEDLEPSFEIIADMLFHSTMKDFEKEKIRLHGELIMELDSPRNRSHDLLMTNIFKDTPYKASHTNILATIPVISSSTTLINHYRDIYQPANMIFCVVGNIPVKTIKDHIDHFFVCPKGQNYFDYSPPADFIIAENQYVTFAKEDSNQLHIFKGSFAPSINHSDYPPMVVLNTILGGAGLTSRLFIELRDKQGLAYNVRSQYEASKYLGLFSMYIGTEPSNRKKALKGFEIECNKLIDQPVGYKELEEAKENILGRRVIFLETALQQCLYMGNLVAMGTSLDAMNTIPERIQEVTALQIQEMAQKYLSQPAIVSAVGPSSHL